MSVLKTCPFCNKPARTAEVVFPNQTKGFRIYCDNDECHIKPRTDTFSVQDAAIDAWNIRRGDNAKRIAELHARLDVKDRIINEQSQNLAVKDNIIHKQAIMISSLTEG